MRVSVLSTIIFLFFILNANSQVSYIHTFGEPLEEEFALNSYPSDPDTAGIVLYERGNYTVEKADGYIRLFKDVHRKIKVLDAKNFNGAEISISYYRERNVRENITGLKAITHNGTIKKYVGESATFDQDVSTFYSEKKFTFPDVKDGSILEYTYRIETPYFFNIGRWAFMNEYPTIYSELHIEIPGNYNYNRTLHGSRELDINHAEIKKACFHLPGFRVPGDCEVATYAMKNVPAFKTENHMLSKHNYIPALNFELAEMVYLDQTRKVYSKSWKNVDREFLANKDLGRQLTYKNYFRRNLPDSILSISKDLDRAKAVYYYMQSRITWNDRERFLNLARVKEAYEEGVGNSSEINLALINALNAVGLDAKIMAIATRDRALPTNLHPVISDFNYAIVFLEIDNKKYFLDATEKYSEFGVLPHRALNLEGRVFDFKKGSYWEPIQAIDKNMHYANIQMEADAKGLFHGKINEVYTGQIALPKRRTNNNVLHEDIIKRKQSENENLNISNYKIENAQDFDQPYKESYDFTLYEQPISSVLYLYPFVMQNYFPENPFPKKQRLYPIDLGFSVSNNYLVSIDVKDQYEIVKVPSNRILKLPENDGELSVVYEIVGSKINIRLNVKLNTTSYSQEAYQSLHEFFDMLVNVQAQEPIELKKT